MSFKIFKFNRSKLSFQAINDMSLRQKYLYSSTKLISMENSVGKSSTTNHKPSETINLMECLLRQQKAEPFRCMHSSGFYCICNTIIGISCSSSTPLSICHGTTNIIIDLNSIQQQLQFGFHHQLRIQQVSHTSLPVTVGQCNMVQIIPSMLAQQ